MTDPTCIFCKIVAGTIPAQRLAEDEHALAFPDINPQAPTHVLVIPKEHHLSVATLPDEAAELPGKLIALARGLAAKLGLDQRGYRLVINTGPEGGQVVPHLHLHLLAGRQMGWPPG